MKKIFFITASFFAMVGLVSAQTVATPAPGQIAKGTPAKEQANVAANKPQPKLAATQTGNSNNSNIPTGKSNTPKLAPIGNGKKTTAPKKP